MNKAMFCVKCGRPIPDGQRLCDACLAAEQGSVGQPEPVETYFADEAYQQVQQPVVPQEDTFTLGGPDIEPPKKKKGKIAAIIAAAAVVVAGVLAIVLNWNSIMGLFGGKKGMPSGTPQEQMISLEKQTTDKAVDSVSKLYGTVKNSGAQEANQTAGKMALRLRVGDMLLESLEQMASTQQQAGGMDMDFLREILLEVSATAQEDRMHATADLSLSGTHIASVDAYIDFATMKMWAAIPELNKDYLALDLSKMMENSGVSMDDMLAAYTAQRALTEKLLRDMPSEQAIGEMLSAYVGIIHDGIEQVSSTSEKVTVGEIEQTLTVLEAKITQRQLLDVATKILQHAKTDDTLKQLIKAFEEYINTSASQSGASIPNGDFYVQFAEGIEDALADLEDEKADCKDGNYLLMSDYVDDSGRIVGRKIRAYSEEENSSEPSEIFYVTVRKDGKFETKASLASVELTGSGTERDGKCNGKYDLNVDGTNYLGIELVDIDMNATESGKMVGTVRVKPTHALFEKMNLDSSVSAMIAMSDMTLEIVGKDAGEATELEVNLLAGGQLMFGLGLKFEAMEGGSVTLPSGGVNAMDEKALQAWTQNVSVDEILGNLSKAGVPSDLLSALVGQMAG